MHALQPGIWFEPSTRPPACFGLLLLDVDEDADRHAARAAIESVVEMLGALAEGEVRELDGQPSDQAGATKKQFRSLRVLVGYGRRLFDHEPPLTSATRPAFLAYLDRGRPPFPALPWGADSLRRNAEADVALQLTADVDAAVNCAAVEVWKLISDETLPLRVHEFFRGFGRIDGRGWLEFHDGVSNMDAHQRLRALEAAPDPAWMGGGTYLAFLRLAVDLAAWRSISRETQELAVGRDKLTGAALVGVERDAHGIAHPVAARAVGAGATPEERSEWRDPPQTTVTELERSHIHRANQSRASSAAPGAFRMFRQGYDFLDALTPDGPVLGLNFVSFQHDLRTVQQVLHMRGWLGDSNFGGDAPGFLGLVAAGLYAVPPVARPFPGADLFAR